MEITNTKEKTYGVIKKTVSALNKSGQVYVASERDLTNYEMIHEMGGSEGSVANLRSRMVECEVTKDMYVSMFLVKETNTMNGECQLLLHFISPHAKRAIEFNTRELKSIELKGKKVATELKFNTFEGMSDDLVLVINGVTTRIGGLHEMSQLNSAYTVKEWRLPQECLVTVTYKNSNGVMLVEVFEKLKRVLQLA